MTRDETLSVIAREREGIFIVKSPTISCLDDVNGMPRAGSSLCKTRGPRQAGRGRTCLALAPRLPACDRQAPGLSFLLPLV